MSVGWIGLGNMGLPMAVNLHRGGFDVKAFDLSSDSMVKADALGLPTASSASDAVRGVEMLFVMLPTGKHVREVLVDSNVDKLAPGAICINCSTISPADARAIAADLEVLELQYIDAPVSGGTVVAQEGALTFMVGASDLQFGLVESVLKTMGRNVFHLGETGCGQAAKIVNNMLLAMNMVSLSEAAVLAGRLGIDYSTFKNVTEVSSGDSWVLRHYFPLPGVVDSAPSNHGYAPGFTAELMRKDVGLALEAAELHGVSAAMTRQAAALLDRMVDSGQAHLDFSAVVRIAAGDI